jgi:hypothetical protein
MASDAFARFLAITLWYFVQQVNGEVRCYCNEANCVRTSYMCKSISGSCFTLLTTDGSNNIRSVHGCQTLSQLQTNLSVTAMT